MTMHSQGPKHYRKAENLLDEVADWISDTPDGAESQLAGAVSAIAHALLALTGAVLARYTAKATGNGGDWREVLLPARPGGVVPPASG